MVCFFWYQIIYIDLEFSIAWQNVNDGFRSHVRSVDMFYQSVRIESVLESFFFCLAKIFFHPVYDIECVFHIMATFTAII